MSENQPHPHSVPVSVLIPVRNEQRNMQACLDTVSWAAEVVVVDSCSADETATIARQAGARVIQFTYKPGGPRKKNWALQNVSFNHDWILILDADERITSGLAAEIAAAVENPGSYAGFYLNRRFNFLGNWIYHAGYFPSWNLRLFRRGLGLYETLSYDFQNSGDNEVHEHVILDGTAGYLHSPMDHFAYPTLAEFIEKHRRYAYWEAEMAESDLNRRQDGSAMSRALGIRRTLKRLGRRLPFPHWLRFFYHYFLKCGFLDGREGYVFCHLLAEYEFWIWARVLELENEKKRGSLVAADQPTP